MSDRLLEVWPMWDRVTNTVRAYCFVDKNTGLVSFPTDQDKYVRRRCGTPMVYRAQFALLAAVPARHRRPAR